MTSCPVFTFMTCWTNKFMSHACVQQESCTLPVARTVHAMLLFKAVVNYLCISQRWTGRSALVEFFFLISPLCTYFLKMILLLSKEPPLFAVVWTPTYNISVHARKLPSQTYGLMTKKLLFKLNAIYNILKFRLTLDMMSLEKNAKDLKRLHGCELIKTLKGSMYQKPVGQSENK